MASALANAHKTYGPANSPIAKGLAVLFIVQPNNVNICDERPIEYLLSTCEPPIQVHRLEFATGQPILVHTSLGPSSELLYHHPTIPDLTHEISVVYLRAGYEACEYPQGRDGTGAQARYQLEKSLAIKCPDVLAHLATFKKVQQALTSAGVVDHFLSTFEPASSQQKKILTDTFMPMHTLAEKHTRTLALDPETAKNYVLKPSSMEGGGHNIFRKDIPIALTRQIPKDQWKNHILMELINPPESQQGILLNQQGQIYAGETTCELGVIGTCMWRRQKSGIEKQRTEIMENNGAVGWTFKTKPRDIDEMSVVKGYGCFGSPFLV